MSKFNPTHLSLWEGSPLCPLPKWCPYAIGIESPPQMEAGPQQECWGASTAQCPSRIVQAHLILLHFADTAFLKKKKKKENEGLWPPCIQQVYRCHFSNSICFTGFASLCPILVTLSPSTFFFTVTFVRWSVILECYSMLLIFNVILAERFLTRWRLTQWLAFFSSEVFLFF